MNDPVPIRSFGDLANAAIEKMGRSDRRKIFSEINDNWDENRARYLGDVGDHQIAAKLNVPRAWVEHIRKESFGDDATNEDMELPLEELKRMEGKLGVATNDALQIASKIEGYYNEVKALKKRVEKIEAALTGRR